MTYFKYAQDKSKLTLEILTYKIKSQLCEYYVDSK